MIIPLSNLWTADEPYRIQIDNAIMEVVNKSAFIGGEYVNKFEENFAKYLGIKYCVGLSSCTAALQLALECLEIKGKVLVPVMTVTADAEAVLHAGCTPVFYDIVEDLYPIDSDIKAIIVVHLYGNPEDMNAIKTIAKQNNLFIIEDCAQSTGATYKGKMTGTFGDVACYSFFPTKVLGGYGDGGALVTNSEMVADRVRALRNHGRLKGEKHKHHLVGYNYRLDGMKAAILDIKLRYLDEFIAKRRRAAAKYDELLEWMDSKFTMDDGCVYYMYPVLVEKRKELIKYLKKYGIGTGIHYPIPIHKQPAFSKYTVKSNGAYGNYIAEHELSLPMFPGITDDEIEYVCRKIKEFYE